MGFSGLSMRETIDCSIPVIRERSARVTRGLRAAIAASRMLAIATSSGVGWCLILVGLTGA